MREIGERGIDEGCSLTNELLGDGCFVEIFSLTPRFNAVNHEGEMGKTV